MSTATDGSVVKLAPGGSQATAALDLLGIEAWWASARVEAVGGGDMRVALALGGGARGYAHIGVIQVLEECGFDIAGIAGSSVGALVGGLYAAGKLDAYVDWVRTIGYREVLRLLDRAIRAPGAFRADRVMARVGELLDGVHIEQLPVPFTAVATGLLARRAVWFQHGPLDIAVRASIALPLMITPAIVNGRLLADGGLMDPLPMAPTSSIPADAVVAVSLNGARASSHPAAPVRESADPHPTRVPWNQVQGDIRAPDRDGIGTGVPTTAARRTTPPWGPSPRKTANQGPCPLACARPTLSACPSRPWRTFSSGIGWPGAHRTC